MAQISFPFENVDTTESQYSLLFRELQDTGVVGDLQNQILEVNSGGGLNIILKPGVAIVRGYAYQNTTDLTLVLDAGNAQARIDTVVIRLDPSQNTIVAAIKKGTPASVPSAPALTQTSDGVWEMPLANIAVAANATSVGALNITDRRPFAGTRVGFWTNATRPETPRSVQMGWNYETNKFEFWSGNDWASTFPITVENSKYKFVGQTNATSLTIDPSQSHTLMLTTASSAVTVTIASGSLQPNERMDIIQDGTGQITFVAGPGVTLGSKDNKVKTAGRYSGVSLMCVASGSYRLVGDLVL